MTFNISWFLGFVDGEGCFHIDVHLHSETRWGLQIQPEFTVVQHERDIALLKSFETEFGCGSVGINRRDTTSTRYHYRVKNLTHLEEKIIPFFQANPLKTKKSLEFERFTHICSLMSRGYHKQSLGNFLEVITLAKELRERDPNRPKRKAKSPAMEKHIEKLKKQWELESTVKKD